MRQIKSAEGGGSVGSKYGSRQSPKGSDAGFSSYSEAKEQSTRRVATEFPGIMLTAR